MPFLSFKGKAFVQNAHLAVPFHELVPVKAKSLTKKVSLHDNLIIHGDNLKALKALLPTYAGKVKCIYIDPPYNTGNEHWAYNDNVNSPMMQEWLGKVVDRDDLTRHDKWLCMMTPRLKLLRELLREDGMIFISIDDNEVAHLRMLMNEVFGDENFVAELVWHKKKGGGSDAKFFAIEQEYILVYARNKASASDLYEKYDDEYLKRYSESDSIGRYFWDTYMRKAGKQFYAVRAPDGTTISKDSKGRPISWIRSEARFKTDLASGEARFVKHGKGWSVVFKQRLPEAGKTPRSIITDYSTSDGNDELLNFFGKAVFDNPKPSGLLQKLIGSVAKKEEIVLDSFAGSGTTAHAVLALNKEDGGNRRFVLVEMEDYADKITAERVRRVIKGVPKAKDETLKTGLGGTFSFFELGEPIELEGILSGDRLPEYGELARYAFYTATGEEFDEKAVDAKRGFIGASKDFDVYLLYKTDLDYLKKTALTLEFARGLGKGHGGRRRLVFAPTKYLSQEHLDEFRIDFAQLPFEIYRMSK